MITTDSVLPKHHVWTRCAQEEVVGLRVMVRVKVFYSRAVFVFVALGVVRLYGI